MTSARRSPVQLARRTAVAVLTGAGLVLAPVTAVAQAAEPSSSSQASGYPAAPTPAAQKAVDTAMDQRGKPYEYGAAGPDRYDCSGLTMYSWNAAGVHLPHSAKQQSTMGTAVARDQLQPGDLVFFYSGPSHVGIYIGNNQVVHAPESGDVVKVSDIDAIGDYHSARRVG